MEKKKNKQKKKHFPIDVNDDVTPEIVKKIMFFKPTQLLYTIYACADPEIFMRGGPTEMVILVTDKGGGGGGGVQPPKNPEITFFR